MLGKRWLIAANALLWTLAGFNIARIGIKCALHASMAIWIWAVPVFAAFFMMFRRIIEKNAERIRNFETDKAALYRFLTLKGYLIIAFMMTLGITLRSLGTIPDCFFAFFYSGLGTALMVAGLTGLAGIRDI